MKKTRIIVLMGLFIALSVIFTRILRPVELPFVRVSFGFVITSLSAIALGPVLAGVIAAIADILGFFLFPAGAAFFPGFTLSALIAGIFYGLFLYKKPVSIFRVALAVLAVSLVVDLGLNSIWLSILYKKAWAVFISQRILKTAIIFPVQIALVYAVWKYIGSYYEKNFGN